MLVTLRILRVKWLILALPWSTLRLRNGRQRTQFFKSKYTTGSFSKLNNSMLMLWFYFVYDLMDMLLT